MKSEDLNFYLDFQTYGFFRNIQKKQNILCNNIVNRYNNSSNKQFLSNVKLNERQKVNFIKSGAIYNNNDLHSIQPKRGLKMSLEDIGLSEIIIFFIIVIIIGRVFGWW
ncbi:MAG: hypothetical protein KJ674_01415 [Nanoarchaeota archaeon]|nr:hypothetical protein [Nanoarchaeota archaeon]